MPFLSEADFSASFLFSLGALAFEWLFLSLFIAGMNCIHIRISLFWQVWHQMEKLKPCISQIEVRGLQGTIYALLMRWFWFYPRFSFYYNLGGIWVCKNFYQHGTSLATEPIPCTHSCNPKGLVTCCGMTPGSAIT